jgi:hypothetical protein
MKSGILIFLAVGLLLVVAYKRSETKTPDSPSSAAAPLRTSPAAATEGPSSANTGTQNSINSETQSSASGATSSYSYTDPPQADAGMSVDDAYAVIPHRRTVWSDDQTTVPAGEREYLKAMFQVLDQTVVARSAGIQNYSRGNFTSFDAEGELEQLSDYVRQAQVPPGLADYDRQVLAALAGEQQFFHDWTSDPDHFNYTTQVNSHPGVNSSSAALRAAYQVLMSRYPQESQANQDAFFDYHCAADFR